VGLWEQRYKYRYVTINLTLLVNRQERVKGPKTKK
jgi:hypothetical protein